MSSRSRIKMRHLQAFAEVVRCGGVSKAANALFITQSAVSRSLSELEDILGAPLMAREVHGGVPTQYGEVFFRYAEQTLALLREGQNAVARARERGGFKINCGILPNMAARIAPLAIGDFVRDNPNVAVAAMPGATSHLLASLKSGALEFVIGRLTLTEEMEGVHFEHLYFERLALAVRAGHPLLSFRRQEPSDDGEILREMGKYPLAHVPPHTGVREDMERLFLQNGAPLPSRRVDTDSVALSRRLTLKGDAVWCFPQSAMTDDLQDKTMEELPVDMSGTARSAGISTRVGAHPSPQCAELMDKIRQYAGKIRDGKI